ncbi:DgyrCDS7544 [Dimorphilus gyrociliatus]|uniref:DgyrCDS7544 n=1 Tax=Dimorphilus gyrociliatus TaxID=2664684 RepID=A0A7I8VWA9_9ANNE|nr:DgyrCDS7544 [Dimorphilus gyrociliatus]
MLKLFNRRSFIHFLILLSQYQLGCLGRRSQNNLLRTLSFLTKSSWNDNSTEDNEQKSQLKSSSGEQFQYENDVILDGHKRFHLFWNFDNVLEEVTFEIEAKIKKDQFFAFGFSDYGEFINADYAILWTDKDGKPHFQDAHTDHSGLIHVDKSQDYNLLNFTTKSNKVILTFKRFYDTCDNDDYLIDSGTTHLLYAVGIGHPRSAENINITSLRPSMTRVQIIKSELVDPEFPKDTETFAMTVENVKVPAEETTYWCVVKKLPNMSEKHHIIQFGGKITPTSEGVVHHMEVFHCDAPPGVEIPHYEGKCIKEGRPKGLESCRNVIGAWAMGAQPLTYPEEAGYPVGGKDSNPYVMLEVHYNNPDLISGIVDSSGIEFHVTKTLRKYDAGIMELGLEYTDKYALPPGLNQWDLDGHCIPECTKVGLPEKGIKVFASQLHTHLTGRRAFTKHYRNGVELPELNRDNHYSPHFQEIRKLKRQVTVLPGDSLVTTCQDQTANRRRITLVRGFF